VFATVTVALVSLVLFVLSNLLGTVGDVLSAAITAIGLQIAVYYGLAGLAVVLAYRRVLLKSVSNLVFIGVWPLLGSAFMIWIFIEAIATGSVSGTALWVGLGALAIGLVPMIWYWVQRVPYYRTPPLERFTDAQPLATTAGVETRTRETLSAAVETPEPV
jgi:hypothetical protein